jgi:hypothetical protein
MEGQGYFPQECAPEIETALVAGLWHEPFRLAPTLRWLDLDAHLSQPYLRLVVGALARCYSELGAVDFASVVECLRQLGQLDECGGVQTLDTLYEARWYAPLFDLYGDFLRAAALRRGDDQKAPVPFFSGGNGLLVVNKIRQSERSPFWVGSAWVAGKKYSLKAWPRKGEQSVDIKFTPQ